jgi:hypothetical protein
MQSKTSPRIAPPRLPTLALSLVLAGLAAPGCNRIETRPAHAAALSRMIPGPAESGTGVACWLTLEFNRYPKDGDPTDVVVRFDSIALREPVAFDWAYIASHDKLTAREGFGSGLHEAEVTDPERRPPLGRPTQVRFPLPARATIDDAPATLYLEAELYWGGVRQSTLRQSLEHVYAAAADDRY